ncbi:MAG: LD-carboxypeptidase [Pseudoflavonifractor sp.]|nr:LD-carboxypeptidase [Alloprevotella sp.]MCM1117072.1 LD-carboxypeptidase [Pseudoflavonifractor sp.]
MNAIVNTPLIIPPALKPADRIAILSPSGAVKPALIDSAAAAIASAGFAPVVMPHAKGQKGTYSGDVNERFADMAAAVADRSIKAILCARGGYGAVHLLDRLSALPLRANAKWLIGFSDISALHALWSAYGIASVHGPMARHLSVNGAGHPATRALFAILRGEKVEVTAPAHPLNREGRTAGVLLGGNLAVLHGLVGSRYDMLRPDSILVIEDINEPIYRVERMLWQMKLSGVLERLRGLIVGNFKGADADANHESVEAMIAAMTSGYGYPVAFGAPVGHILENMPLRLSAPAVMSVDSTGSLLLE